MPILRLRQISTFRPRILAIALCVAVTLVSCSRTPTPPTSIYFPRQRADINGYMSSAVLGAKLTNDNGCLRLSHRDLIIWPPGYKLSVGNDIQVLNASGEMVAQVGSLLTLGGGNFPDQSISQVLAEPLPQQCNTGPFWLASPQRVATPTP